MKLTTPGPLTYTQRRIGRGRKEIGVLKFRSMKIEYCTGPGYSGDAAFKKLLDENPDLAAEWKQYFKLKEDPRVSRAGKILRKTNLDELPQFWNVIRGELSLVGPRAIIKDEVEKYGETADILFTVRPGITGPWQVSGRNDISYDERVRLDAQYIRHWNLLTDIGIVFKTVWVIAADIIRTILGRKSTSY
jgi:undecaprenyl-phosphate galactose phosphotransferase